MSLTVGARHADCTLDIHRVSQDLSDFEADDFEIRQRNDGVNPFCMVEITRMLATFIVVLQVCRRPGRMLQTHAQQPERSSDHV